MPLKFGTITQIDTIAGRARIKMPEHDGIVSYWLPIAHAKTSGDQFCALPEVGQHVAVLMDDRHEDGAIIGAIYSGGNKPPVDGKNKFYMRFSDGAVFEYDKETHVLTLTLPEGGRCDFTGDLNITGNITHAGALNVDGDVAITGSLTVGGRTI